MNTQTKITRTDGVCTALLGLVNKAGGFLLFFSMNDPGPIVGAPRAEATQKDLHQLSTCPAISIPDQACSHASVFSPVKHFINILTCDMRRSLSGKLFGGMSQARIVQQLL